MASDLDPEELFEKVREQVARNSMHFKWKRVHECPEMKFSRTYFNKEQFVEHLQSLKVNLQVTEIRILWNALVDKRTRKVPVDTFEKKCINRKFQVSKNLSTQKRQKERFITPGKPSYLSNTASYNEIRYSICQRILQVAKTKEKQRLKRLKRYTEEDSKINLSAAFDVIFFEDHLQKRDTFDKPMFLKALNRLGFSGEFAIPSKVGIKLFREIDKSRKGYICYYAFCNWMLKHGLAHEEFAPIKNNMNETESKNKETVVNDILLEGCWTGHNRRSRASKDSALQCILVEILRSSQSKRRIKRMVKQYEANGETQLHFNLVLERLHLENQTDETKLMLAKLLLRSRDGNVNLSRLQEITFSKRGLRHWLTNERNCIAISNPSKAIYSGAFQSLEEFRIQGPQACNAGGELWGNSYAWGVQGSSTYKKFSGWNIPQTSTRKFYDSETDTSGTDSTDSEVEPKLNDNIQRYTSSSRPSFENDNSDSASESYASDSETDQMEEINRKDTSLKIKTSEQRIDKKSDSENGNENDIVSFKQTEEDIEYLTSKSEDGTCAEEAGEVRKASSPCSLSSHFKTSSTGLSKWRYEGNEYFVDSEDSVFTLNQGGNLQYVGKVRKQFTMKSIEEGEIVEDYLSLDDSSSEYESDIEYEEKEDVPESHGPTRCTVEIIPISCRKLNQQNHKRTLYVRSTLMPWGIQSDVSAGTKTGCWTKWKHIKKHKKKKSLIIKYPMDQVPISLVPSKTRKKCIEDLEGRVCKSRPHVVIELLQDKWLGFQKLTGKTKRCVGRFEFSLGPYLKGVVSTNLEVLQNEDYEIQLNVRWKEK